MSYKETILLPKTSFSMKGNLIRREPKTREWWSEIELRKRIREARSGGPSFILHDGPPYANGHVHLGTALNKVLKDFIVKSHTIMGYDSPYLPGWDCHGMPIEHKVVGEAAENGESLPREEIRQRCREYAARFVEVQREEFARLGVFGSWEHPYLTMDYNYEAGIIRAFGELVENGYVYLGLRPIHWCTSCSTALADAEVEYGTHRSPSIYVAFQPLEPDEWSRVGVPEGAEVVIWTTTPWTLPANRAVALHPDERYVLLEVSDGDRLLLVAQRRVEHLLKDAGLEARVLQEPVFTGSDLAGLRLRHPLMEGALSKVITADHVTMADGTGCVHTAPGHGLEDFLVAPRWELEVFSPVDENGEFTAEAGPYAGMHVFDANSRIVDDLEEAGRLIASRWVEHSYPHCWRCNSPLIFRATSQFFLDLSHRDLKDRVLDMVRTVQWHPAWGEDRMTNTMTARPDWCLSRQRAWGVALPVLVCSECGRPVMDPRLIKAVADLVSREGSDVWFEMDPEEIFSLVSASPECPSCGKSSLQRGDDILDVWFDSSLSHYNVLNDCYGLSRPASVYIEATDQHRGWFGVSLITSCALDLSRPADHIITHGLIQDSRGRKMSKSLGNVISPMEVVDRYGADVLRLWFASMDYTQDMRADLGQLDDALEAYRKLRNTLRFMLGNLREYESHSLDPEELSGLDRYIYLRFRQLQQACVENYRSFQFHKVFRDLRNFCVVELSGLYLDGRKDRLYCDHPDDPARRATRAVIAHMLRELVKLLSPVLPYTTEEAWSCMPDCLTGEVPSVHLTHLEEVDMRPEEGEELSRWEPYLQVRKAALKRLEVARAESTIGGGLEAWVRLTLPSDMADSALGEPWEDLLIVSKVETSAGDEVSASVSRAGGAKCARCWKWLPEVGSLEHASDLCHRCSEVLKRMGGGGE
ncbi:isoleucine--tRNA ligase [Candidatus Fermentibacteria bacterium]|nr:isoleucine--tRNA ligase [Candidatus Fermentibacteria bacterium]